MVSPLPLELADLLDKAEEASEGEGESMPRLRREKVC
jgi:hypothetical protein